MSAEGGRRWPWPARLAALTVHQPWASCIARGPKRVENRDWTFPLPRGGGWLLIHAGRQVDLYGTPENALRALWPEMPPLDELPLGAALALARVTAIVRPADVPRARRAWASGPWCWLLEDVLALPEPAPCRGMPGLWRPPDELVETARALWWRFVHPDGGSDG